MSDADAYINTCVCCHNRLGKHSFRCAVVCAEGLAEFRLCAICRPAATDELLSRIVREAHQRFMLTGKVGGHA